MVKLILLYRTPDDVAAFETRWSRDFVPLLDRIPGLRRVAVSRTLQALSGEVDLYLTHELFFDDLLAAREALATPEGQAAGRALMGFAAGIVTLCLAHHLEDLLPGPDDEAGA